MKLADNMTKDLLGFDYILDKLEVATPYGRDMKNSIKPYLRGEEHELKKEFDILKDMINLININSKEYRKIKSILYHIKDIRGSIDRAANSLPLTIVELFEIKCFMFLITQLNEKIEDLKADIDESVKVHVIKDINNLLDPKKNGIKTFFIYDEYSIELTDIRTEKRRLAELIKKENKKQRDKINSELKIRINITGEITILKEDVKLYEKIANSDYFEYLSETPVSYRYKMKLTKGIKDKLERLDVLKCKEEQEELKIRTYLSNKIAYHKDVFKTNFEHLAKLDLTIAKAMLAIDTNSVRPTLITGHSIRIEDGTYLKIAEDMNKKGGKYIPISVDIKDRVTCITGANMGGKTVSLKLIGLLCMMVQYGLFVPCKSMQTSLHDFIFISTGDLQSADMGLSTFGGEIHRINKAIDKATDRGLILIDELASGTNPNEGYAISKAIVKYLIDQNSISIITTHFDNIANSSGVKHLQVVGLKNVDYKKLEYLVESTKDINNIRDLMDYRLIKVTNVSEVPKDAINIAKLMGLKESIILHARDIVSKKSNKGE
ncbi:hypothetical protein PV797_21550 [Clostridiaceae bacterium M8S5]|nr:hypothetical protein PV797_21550 [Clostridiaceae bacterium M8S5]